jgi:hypothetical protein
MNTPLEIIWNETYIAHESLQELRKLIRLIGRTNQLPSQLTISLTADGSANSISPLSEENLMSLIREQEGQIGKGSFYSFGFIPNDTADRRPSFQHKFVEWFLVQCWFRGSELWDKPPYPGISSQINSFVGEAKEVIWMPLRAICNDEYYHDGKYQFGETDPFASVIRVYKHLLDLLIGTKPELANAPVFLIGDMRTEKILRGHSSETVHSLIGENCFYFQQPLDVRFDFLIADFARQFPHTHNYVISGDSSAPIPLIGCTYQASFLMGYPMNTYIEVGAAVDQCLYVQNRIVTYTRAAMAVLFSTSKVQASSIRFDKLDEGVYLLDVQMQT